MSTDRRNKSGVSKGMILTVIWLLTALCALIVTIVYFDRLDDIYSKVQMSEAGDTPEAEQGAEAITRQASGTDAGYIYEDEAPADSTGDDGTDTDPDTSEGTEEPADTGEVSSDTGEVPADIEDVSTDTEEEPEDDGDHPYYYDKNLDPSKPIIAFSFDDGPSQYTEQILAALEKYDSKATFFMVGYNLDYYSDVVKKVYDAGQEIGNHTTDHTGLTTGSGSEIQKRVADNEKMINDIVPVGRIIVRPPYGTYNDKTKELIDRPMVCWSIDSRDWETRNTEKIVAQIQHDAHDGYIVLMHDLYKTTADAVDIILPWLIDQGYQVTCISNMYEVRGETMKDGHVYSYTSPAPQE